MATETSSERTVDPDNQSRTASNILIESVAVMGLSGSLLVVYALGIVVVAETIGPSLAASPEWFIIAMNAAVSVPALAGLAAVGLWVAAVVRGKAPKWEQIIIHSAAAAVVMSPIMNWVTGVL